MLSFVVAFLFSLFAFKKLKGVMKNGKCNSSKRRKYQVKTISPVESEYLNALKEINNKLEEKNNK